MIRLGIKLVQLVLGNDLWRGGGILCTENPLVIARLHCRVSWYKRKSNRRFVQRFII